MWKFTNSEGMTYELTEKFPDKLISFDTGVLEVTMQKSSAALQDGSRYIDSFLDDRELTVTFMIQAKSIEERIEKERRLDQIFSPKLRQGQIEFRGRVIDVVVNGGVIKSQSESTSRVNRLSILFTAHEPYWKKKSSLTAEIAAWKKNFIFPYQITKKKPIVTGIRQSSLIVNCINDGDETCGMRVVFKATHSVSKPLLFNVDTREFIQINKEMLPGDVIEITTHFGNKKIFLHRNGVATNYFQYLDPSSTFMQLKPGDNFFRFDTEESSTSLNIDIEYNPRYIGV